MVYILLRLFRVKQYIKNIFVLAPLFFSCRFTEFSAIAQTASAFILFCLTASIVYIQNDIADVAADRQHPRKKHHPLPAGLISILQARILCVFLLTLIGAGAYLLPLENRVYVLAVLLLYVLINICYSLRLKHVVILDVFIIATGFILRVYAGALAINVPVSGYIFTTTFFLSLFLGFSKRLAEAAKNYDARPVLKSYTVENLKTYVTVTAALTIMSYALYTLEPATIARFGTSRLIFSVVFVTYGLFHYQQLIQTPASEEDPTENMYHDKTLIGVCAAYCVYVILVLTKII